MKLQKRQFIVEIKHSRRSRKTKASSIWGNVDLAASQPAGKDGKVAGRLNVSTAPKSDDLTTELPGQLRHEDNQVD